ncbi:hypothetical protein ECHHL_0854 [Ehrlichia chaffeensis str. Heartland]|nr:hypothetical protein ECHHL_0854 [Ehrlichia chaffeensis str. Heartland]AHX05279.1 hypothetical protein ECHJAX_0191 [Ehrlichia chaffeensis str. Jax]AHX06267.1 hypothetical protein ECHLIB_0188 [Ehrlichia chaffeensis str. Liberty]AHX07382.1 hypothetical protein ECHOSC_0869 [Ehrlichia chaffeensis str. Osceola]AHX09428.1 hypothetical protein ECHWAK_0189 [Ehrlichia chaffeensis str. Wakulla]AHX10396.1 hypothetical protein ECHWP_0850 [Ehrlichia chaffeensis str. West Paces]
MLSIINSDLVSMLDLDFSSLSSRCSVLCPKSFGSENPTFMRFLSF